MTLRAGSVLAQRYRADEMLGRGGMGEVWRCLDLEQARDVAVKAVRAELLTDPIASRLFHAEVVAVARLSHTGIVPVYDLVRDDDGTALLVMEYRRGQSLASFVRLRPAWTFIRDVLVQLLEALAYAHARGVLHLDLKPENVVIELDGGAPFGPRAAAGADTAKDLRSAPTERALGRGTRPEPALRATLVDFGIARVRRPGLGVERWTDAGAVVGTIEYMAPEQFTGAVERIGPWTDLYSIGVLAYELCSGRRPFPDAEPMQAAVLRLGTAAPRLAPRTGDVPTAFLELCAELLETHPKDRPFCAADVLDALREMGLTRAFAPARSRDVDESSEISERREMLETVLSDSFDLPPPGPTSPRMGRFTAFDPARMFAAAEEPPEAARPAAGAYGLFGLRELPVLGRLEERRALWAALRASVVERRPYLVLLEGPAGAGKSRLARDLLERAVELGVCQAMQTSWSASGSGDEGLRGLVENLLDTRGAPGAQVRGRLAFWLARLPGVRDAFPRDVELLLRPPPDAAPDAELPLRVAVEAIALATELRPVILWLDDVPWSRGEAAALVRRIAEQRPALPVCIVATAREEELVDRALFEVLSHGSTEELESGATIPPPPSMVVSRVTRVEVAPLDRSATHDLVRGLLDVDDGLAALLSERAEGNPLFVTQMLRQLVAAEAVVRHEGRYRLVEGFDPRAIPADLGAVWERRVALSGASPLALAALALVRDRVSKEVEQELARLYEDATVPASRGAPADLVGFPASIARSLSAGLLRLEGNAYVWAHGLLRDYLVQQIAGPSLARLSALAAAALGVLVGREDVQEERARHLLRAEGRARDACEAMLDAGVWSFRRAEGPARKRRFEALRTWAHDASQPDLEARALAELAYLKGEGGGAKDAVADFEPARTLLGGARAFGKQAAWVAFREGQVLRLAGRAGEGPRLTDEAITRARASGVLEVEILGLVQKGVDAARADDAEHGRAFLGEAIALAELAGDRPGHAQALLTLAHLEPKERALATLEKSLTLARAAGALRVELIAKQVEVQLLWEAGARDAARKGARALAEEAARRSLRQTVSILALQRGSWSIEEADLPGAREAREEAARWGAATGPVAERATLLGIDVVLALAEREGDRAEALLLELERVRGRFLDGALKGLLARARAYAEVGSPARRLIDSILA